jgi:hypothetical protein
MWRILCDNFYENSLLWAGGRTDDSIFVLVPFLPFVFIYSAGGTLHPQHLAQRKIDRKSMKLSIVEKTSRLRNLELEPMIGKMPGYLAYARLWSRISFMYYVEKGGIQGSSTELW